MITVIEKVEKMNTDIYFLPFRLGQKIRVEVNDGKTHVAADEIFLESSDGDIALQFQYLTAIQKYIEKNQKKFVWVCLEDFSVNDEKSLFNLISKHLKINPYN